MFVERYKKVVTSRNSTYEDSYRRFSTKFFDNIFMGCTNKNNK